MTSVVSVLKVECTTRCSPILTESITSNNVEIFAVAIQGSAKCVITATPLECGTSHGDIGPLSPDERITTIIELVVGNNQITIDNFDALATNLVKRVRVKFHG